MSKITKLARGQQCTLRFLPPCEGDVVAAHYHRRGFGMVGKKVPDLFTIHACQRCHRILDRQGHEWMEIENALRFERALAGLIETQLRMLEAGLVRMA